MAQKQSVFGRMSQLLKANVNALIDKAEDPQKMIDQLIRDYTNEIAEAEKAIAQTIGNLRLQEQDLHLNHLIGNARDGLRRSLESYRLACRQHGKGSL